MSECKHIYGADYSWDYVGGYALDHWSLIEWPDHEWTEDDTRFNFCPRCGERLLVESRE